MLDSSCPVEGTMTREDPRDPKGKPTNKLRELAAAELNTNAHMLGWRTGSSLNLCLEGPPDTATMEQHWGLKKYIAKQIDLNLKSIILILPGKGTQAPLHPCSAGPVSNSDILRLSVE